MASLTDWAEIALLYLPYDYYGSVYGDLHKINDLRYVDILHCSSLKTDASCSSYLSK